MQCYEIDLTGHLFTFPPRLWVCWPPRILLPPFRVASLPVYNSALACTLLGSACGLPVFRIDIEYPWRVGCLLTTNLSKLGETRERALNFWENFHLGRVINQLQMWYGIICDGIGNTVTTNLQVGAEPIPWNVGQMNERVGVRETVTRLRFEYGWTVGQDLL